MHACVVCGQVCVCKCVCALGIHDLHKLKKPDQINASPLHSVMFERQCTAHLGLEVGRHAGLAEGVLTPV